MLVLRSLVRRRRGAAARAAHVDRRRPPRRLVLLPPRAGRLPDRGRFAARGRPADRLRRDRRGRASCGGWPARSAGPWRGSSPGSLIADLRRGDRRIDLHLEPEPHRALERRSPSPARGGRGRGGRPRWWVVAAIGTAVTMQCHVLGGRAAARRRGLFVVDCASPRPGRWPPSASLVVVAASPISRSSANELTTDFSEIRAALDYLAGGRDGGRGRRSPCRFGDRRPPRRVAGRWSG